MNPTAKFSDNPKVGSSVKMRLVFCGEQRALALSSALRQEIQMGFETVLAAGERLIFVDVNFEGILRRQRGCVEEDAQRWKES
jgi:hypothetical protein